MLKIKSLFVLCYLLHTFNINALHSAISPPYHHRIPQCSIGNDQIPVLYKDREVILEIPTEVISNQTTTICAAVFRSPFQCPHPYSVQVIEDNPQTCHQNLQNCVLHQRIYWTRDGVLEVDVQNLGRSTRQFQLILHVLRLDCDKKLKANLQGHDKRTSVPLTSKLRLTINEDAHETVEMELLTKTAKETQLSVQTTTLEKDKSNLLWTPQPATNYFMTSPGFPRNPVGYSDCFLVIPPTSFKTCRVRIYFRFFNLPDPDERSCQYHYLIVDNKRICGCKTGLLYLSQLDNRPKVIRYVNRLNPLAGGSTRGSVGFLLEVQREGCPHRYTNLQHRHQLYPKVRAVEPSSGMFYPKSFIEGPQKQCHFSFNDWLKVLANPVWGNRKPHCTAGQVLQYV